MAKYTLESFRDKVLWEGGLCEFVNYGFTEKNFDLTDPVMNTIYNSLCDIEAATKRIYDLLPEEE